MPKACALAACLILLGSPYRAYSLDYAPPVRHVHAATIYRVTWYAYGHGHPRTASGERFDRDALTCAVGYRRVHGHIIREWPFGTRLKLTCGDRSVVVRVTDAMPNAWGRKIDLTPAAFKILAPLRQGVARVKIEQIKGDVK